MRDGSRSAYAPHLNPIVRDDLERIDHSLSPGDAFRDATIVVTGCAGFLGFYIMQYLVYFARPLGVRHVVGLDTFRFGKPAWLARLAETSPDLLDLHKFDISRDSLDNVGAAPNATHIIHMASIASPTFYRQFPVQTVDANVWGLRRLLDFSVGSKNVKGLLFFSSSEIYGDPDADHIPTNEEYRGNVSAIGPRACYDEAKRFGETLCYIYAHAYGLPITIARPFNNYGPGMRVDDRRLPADFAKCVIEGRDIVIYSDGLPTRTFCYISDAIAGYLKCLTYSKFEYFNIGIDRPEISVARLAEIYQEAGKKTFGYTGKVRFEKSTDAQYLTDNPNRRCPIIDKAVHLLGYRPHILIEEGVERYLKFLGHETVLLP